MTIKSIEDGYQSDRQTPFWEQADLVRFGPRTYEASVDGQGGTIRGKPVFTKEEAAYYLNRGDGVITVNGVSYNSGANWLGAKGDANNTYYDLAATKGNPSGGPLNEIAFGFYETQATLPEPYIIRLPNGSVVSAMGQTNGFSAFTAAQREATRLAISMWDDLIDVKFVEKHFSQADINLMNTTTGPIQASAYPPYDYGNVTYTNGSPVINSQGQVVTYAEIAGDVYINPNQASNAQFLPGQYGLDTLIHELGHSLGLDHPGAYNFGPGFDVTYDNGAEYYQDSRMYSIMSYWDAEETGASSVNWATLNYSYNSTPKVHDILAIQRIYGADLTTRTGDTVYGFNSNAGKDMYDFSKTPAPSISIYDAGGNDTLDLSGYNTRSFIDLNPGSFSSAGGFYSEDIPTLDEINSRRAALGLAPRTQADYDLYIELFGGFYTDGLMRDNISIAYNSIIENAVGGDGDDTIVANGAANRLDGGGGNDIVSYQTSGTAVSVNLANGLVSGGAAGDVLISIEGVTGSRHNDVLTGSDGDNVLNGIGGADIIYGRNGNDEIDGGEGNDQLFGDGGNDTIRGGEGNDTIMGGAGDDILFGDAGNDTLYGDAGNDVLDGGAGDDKLYGGAGADTFRFSDLGGYDTIVDFRRGQGDKIDLTGIDPNINVDAVNEQFNFIGNAAFSGTAGELRTFVDRGSTIIAGDVNGDGVADFQINVGATAIRADDLILTVNVAA
ncbi:M10 family metallopeptidase [Allosphingosinicella indica]|uniref:Serralysin n=1 Tax=Allosphingosinicella indica TaxID=941907 RepID=A0A1X7G0Z9_9SPHN|nr:M10 family metallopeptidase C-terminal domain-containing protein [Allosphingosinicella indica]SMF61553.1 serralysin [Allosphingosinicella indica]